MRTFSIQSGSNGNCIFVETSGVKLLFDAGVSGIVAEQRMRRYGFDIREVDGLIISHDHSDHTRAMGVLSRKYGLTVYVTEKTLQAVDPVAIGELPRVQFFRSGSKLKFGRVVVETIPTPHDAADGVSFIVCDGKARLGIMTDLGHPFRELTRSLATLDAVYLESNYDHEMLQLGRYPAFLKKRIRGPHGHLSNIESAELLKRFAEKLRWACLSHLSAVNNTPTIALRTHYCILGEKIPLGVAWRDRESPLFDVKHFAI